MWTCLVWTSSRPEVTHCSGGCWHSDWCMMVQAVSLETREIVTQESVCVCVGGLQVLFWLHINFPHGAMNRLWTGWAKRRHGVNLSHSFQRFHQNYISAVYETRVYCVYAFGCIILCVRSCSPVSSVNACFVVWLMLFQFVLSRHTQLWNFQRVK